MGNFLLLSEHRMARSSPFFRVIRPEADHRRVVSGIVYIM